MAQNDYEIGKNPPPRRHMGPGGPGGGFGVPGEKPKNFGQTLGKLAGFIRAYLIFIVIALLLSVVSTVFTLVGPDQLGKITNIITAGIMTGIDLGQVTRICLTLACLYAAGFVFNYTQGFIMATVTQRVTRKFRTEIAGKINRLPLRYYDGVSYGDVMSRVTNDVDTIGMTLNQSVGALVNAATMFAGSLFMMLRINPIMTGTAAASTILGFVLMMIIMKKSQKYFISQQRELGAMNGHIEEIYAGHTVVRAYNAEENARLRFGEINARLRASAWRSQFFSGMMMPLMGFIGNFGYVAVCVVGAALTMNGSAEFGDIISFMIYIRFFTQPLSQFAQAATALQSAAAAGERVFGFLEERELENESAKSAKLPEKIRGDIEFRNVRFGYSEDKVIIKDFSAKAESGQKIAIVGPTGAGKTTLVNLLMRFYETDGGDILVDGIPIKSLTREAVHSMFGMVLQDAWLFEGTIRDNIVYNKQNVTEDELDRACRAAEIHHFIRTLPGGYNTELGENAGLSAGQKQLITIARAILQDAPMLILDEATSSVDARTEALIQRAMDRLMSGRTSFVIAHRLSTIKNADLILVIRDGDIAECGKHDELLQKNGFYAELYNSQFEQAG